MKPPPDRATPSPLLTTPPPDALRAWMQHERTRFDTLELSTALWGAIADELPAPDALHIWAQQHRAAFDVLEPRADLWTAIDVRLAPKTAPELTASRGGGRPAWWQLAAAAAAVFGFGYGLRVGTEPTPTTVIVATTVPATANHPTYDANLHVAAPRHSFRNQEPDPAMQATLLATNIQPEEVPEAPATHSSRAALAPEIARLEARYAALIAHQRAAAQHRFVPTHALADEWDREMTVLDSSYAALRQELLHNPRTDDVMAAMNRNLHLRLKLLQQQMMALDAVQEVRQRAGRGVPRRPPTVNPDDNGVYIEDVAPAGGTRIPPAPPAPAPVPGLGAHVAHRPQLTV